nr:CIA30 family protein [Aquimarina brevivitae]
MIFLVVIVMMSSNSHPAQTQMLFDFSKNATVDQWQIVDDVVMGGRSSGNFRLNDEGHGVFEGKISLANNGGFSSLRYRFDAVNVSQYTKVVLRVKGAKTTYQFRVKADASDYQSYVYPFETTGEWQDIEIPLSEMYPTYRGRKLNMPKFAHPTIEELRFLIGNKKPEQFQLCIDYILLK